MVFGDKRPYSIGATVSANTDYSANEIVHNISQSANLENLSLRIYDGAQLSLRIKAFLIRNDVESELVSQIGDKDYIDGDDDLYNWRFDLPLQRGDQIVFRAKNVDTANDYDFRVNYEIDYATEIESRLGVNL